MRSIKFGGIVLAIAFGVSASPAFARVFEVKVDGRSAPWDVRSNRRLAFGVGDGKAPTFVWGARLTPGRPIKFRATGTAAWIPGGAYVGPNGDSGHILEYSITFLPYHFLDKSRPMGLMGLIGAFVDADGKVIGTPFAIGESATIDVPEGALAISLGVNDDKLGDNDGTFQVTIDVPEPKVTVEENDAGS